MSNGQIEAVKKLVETELKNLTPLSKSWHAQYSSSAYLYIGNLDPRLTEGDVITVFSQFGDVVDINLSRDKDTGKSQGFAFLAFEDQRSTVLAVDNMIGYSLLGKALRVDHVLDYKPPRKYHETERDPDGFKKRLPYEPTGAEGKGIGVYNVTESQRKLNAMGKLKLEATTAAMRSVVGTKKEEDDDDLWAKQFENSLKQELAD